MPEALRQQWARSRRCLLPRLAQTVRSKDRRERIVGGDAHRTGFPDERRNKAPFVRSPLLHSPRRAAGDGENDRFCASASYNACLREIGCEFVAALYLPGSDFHL